MTPGQEILRLIENIGIPDYKKFAEIDARCNCYIRKLDYVHHEIGKTGLLSYKYKSEGPGSAYGMRWAVSARRFTHSRDDLKHARPVGWIFNTVYYAQEQKFSTAAYHEKVGFMNQVHEGALLHMTEELAELHGIIQAMEYDKQNET